MYVFYVYIFLWEIRLIINIAKFDKRWSTIMIMLESSKGGGRGGYVDGGGNSPPPSCATELY